MAKSKFSALVPLALVPLVFDPTPGFPVPDSLVRADVSWSDFVRKLSDTAVANETTDESAFAPTSVLGAVIHSEHCSVRMKILQALKLRQPIARVIDSDLQEYNRLEQAL